MAQVHIRVLWFIGIVAMSICWVQALSDEEKTAFKDKLIPTVTQCAEEYKTTLENIMTAKKEGKIDSLNPCLMSCILQKLDLMTDDGKFKGDEAKKFIKNFSKDEGFVKKAEETIDSCQTENDKEEGELCEKANHIRLCFQESKFWE